jgi:hypothetical protein
MMTHIQHELETIERTTSHHIRQQYKYSTRRSHLTNGNNKVSYHLFYGCVYLK